MKELESFLDSLGIEIESESNTDLIGYCPFHGNRSTPAFNMSKESPFAWRCWNPSCGETGTLLTLVQRIMNVSVLQAARMIHQFEPKETKDIYSVIHAEDQEPYVIWPETMLDKIRINWETFPERGDAFTYLEPLFNRGFDREVLQKFEAGFSKKKQRIVIPVRDEFDRLVGFSGRAFNEDQLPKYWDKGLPKKYILFNLNRAKKYSTVIVVEGSFDAIKIYQAGFENVVAIMGGGFSKEQAKKLTHYFREAIIFTDNDEAGRKLANKVQEAMRKVGKEIAHIKYPEGRKDPGEMTETEIIEAIKHRESLLEKKLRELGGNK